LLALLLSKAFLVLLEFLNFLMNFNHYYLKAIFINISNFLEDRSHFVTVFSKTQLLLKLLKLQFTISFHVFTYSLEAHSLAY
jgi:predicted CDP-diglyceride synthetase/phosphatidate cytidylyltransferase